MNDKIATSHRMADELVDALRDALADADPVTSILLIQQIENACIIRSALGAIQSAIAAGDAP